jgi:hypothetical protein
MSSVTDAEATSIPDGGTAAATKEAALSVSGKAAGSSDMIQAAESANRENGTISCLPSKDMIVFVEVPRMKNPSFGVARVTVLEQADPLGLRDSRYLDCRVAEDNPDSR